MSENRTGPAHVGRETTTEALGKTWRFARWTRSVWARLADEARKHLPDPIEAMSRNLDAVVLKDVEIMRLVMQRDETARLAYVAAKRAEPDKYKTIPPPPVMFRMIVPTSERLAQMALDKASLYLGFQSRELNSWILSPVGASYLFAELLRPAHPDITEDLAFDMIEEVGQKEVERIMETVRGRAKDREGNDEALAA